MVKYPLTDRKILRAASKGLCDICKWRGKSRALRLPPYSSAN